MHRINIYKKEEQLFELSLKKIYKKLEVLEQDVALEQGKTPLVLLKKLQLELKSIIENNEANLKKELINQCNEKIQYLLNQYVNAQKAAHVIAEQHQEALENTIDYYIKGNKTSLFNKNKFFYFNKSTTAQKTTWLKISLKLQQLAELSDPTHTNHNVLSLLLTPNNEDFINLIDMGALTISGEIGYLIVQRLKEIANSDSSKTYLKRVANRTVKQVMSLDWPESLLRFNNQAFEDEITKLVLHAFLHPDKKRIWLGTARTVEAAIKKYPGEGTYLNPASDKWTWELNRAWLQAAVQIGYQFILIEQHFPDVEAAILSCDASKLIEQLAREMRSNSKFKTSQYNGNDSPTATPQEILVLMDMGCIAHKNPADGRLILSSPVVCDEPLPIQKNIIGGLGIKRHHSCPNLRHISSPPPLSNSKDHFIDPVHSNTPITIFTCG
ncbi:hypothetical protein [Legionella sainthelensi]|uniref:hypothetical protein n=1 Tax=Legionella sainthelensi TaxID=28087 RepID=UPI000E20309C|nr:hypothetical protein [Legionella sainthelensi]